MINLTYDDGPNPPYTGQILDVLREFGVKATFFVLGKWANCTPDTVSRIRQDGHTVGNHGFSHVSFALLSEEDAKYDLQAGSGAIFDAWDTRGAVNQPIRVPFGNIPTWMNPQDSVPWDVHGSDWETQDPDAICKPIFAYLDTHKDAIVLLHDGYYKQFGFDRSGTVAATRKILERYPRERFATV